MKRLLTLTIVVLLTGAQALAQSNSNEAHPGSSVDLSLPAPPSLVNRDNLPDAQLEIRALQAVMVKDPDNKDCRLKLAQALESVAVCMERNHDYLGASRCYARASQALDYPKEKSWKKRADDDATKAASSHKLGLDYAKSLKLVGWVYTSFNWHDFKNLDVKAGSDYMTAVGLPIRRNWSVAKRILRVHFPEGQSPKPMLVVSFNVHRDGTVTDIKLAKSCGHTEIDAIAMKAVKDVGKAPPLLPALGNVVPFQSQFIK